ncbi:helix-turn-helix domain-containing protein [Psychromonas sp. Urea-02u-13]|uniref:helix-turn-helix domain-containing protein n=1 Tax=Psychromonas sp. Urea-02u-13 TaxID=2058326 RepID=UPI000C3403F9|nr:helix-turn-helix transcriptional regulator [Psychromonas sp. Urea-02u-13]PKG40502.1 hypothetical protein CXF74_02625 [Psychromonas sp. Urea-02u-13]
MELSTLLQQIRTELSLTQADMVEQLSLFDVNFEHLDLITYSRWERGVSMPSTLRIVHLLGFAHYDKISYLLKLNLKLSETKINNFQKLADAHSQEEEVLLRSFYPVDNPVYIRYNAENPLEDVKQLKKINAATARIFDLPEVNLTDRIAAAIALQKSNNLFVVTCEDEDQRLCAHSLHSVHDSNDKALLVSDIKGFYKVPRSQSVSKDKFLFAHTFSRFNFDWWLYNCYCMLDIICNDMDIKEIISIVLNKHMAKIHKNIGFKLIKKIPTEKEHINGQPKIMSIQREEFLSNHGVISWLKKHPELVNSKKN